MRTSLAALACTLGLSSVGCGSSATSGHERSTGATRSSEGAVVAVVDGAPIARGEVTRLSTREHLAPKEALDALVRWRLLVHEAERRGLDQTPAARLAERRALAQLVLRDLEREVGAAQVTDAMLEAIYEAERAGRAEPERRLVAWVRVEPRLGVRLGDEARAMAVELLGRMASEGVGPVVRDLGEAPPESDRYTFSVEEGQVVDPDPSGVSVLRAAFFAPATPGPLLEPVITPRGVYAAYVIDVFPPRTPSFEQLEGQLRAEALERLRAEAVQSLLTDLRSRAQVRLDEVALAPVLDVGRGR